MNPVIRVLHIKDTEKKWVFKKSRHVKKVRNVVLHITDSKRVLFIAYLEIKNIN